jgi:hypothetical protein
MKRGMTRVNLIINKRMMMKNGVWTMMMAMTLYPVVGAHLCCLKWHMKEDKKEMTI